MTPETGNLSYVRAREEVYRNNRHQPSPVTADEPTLDQAIHDPTLHATHLAPHGKIIATQETQT